MNRLIRFIKVIASLLLILGLYGFGNAVVDHYATIDFEKTLYVLVHIIVALLTIGFVVLIVIFWRGEI